MRDSWWDRKAKELQKATDRHSTKLFYKGRRPVYVPLSFGTSSIYSSDGEIYKGIRHPRDER